MKRDGFIFSKPSVPIFRADFPILAPDDSNRGISGTTLKFRQSGRQIKVIWGQTHDAKRVRAGIGDSVGIADAVVAEVRKHAK